MISRKIKLRVLSQTSRIDHPVVKISTPIGHEVVTWKELPSSCVRAVLGVVELEHFLRTQLCLPDVWQHDHGFDSQSLGHTLNLAPVLGHREQGDLAHFAVLVCELVFEDEPFGLPGVEQHHEAVAVDTLLVEGHFVGREF